MIASNRSSQSDNDLKRKKFRRPAQKLFDIDAIRAIGGEVTQDGDFLIFEGNRFTRKGYLYKTFAMSAIMADGVKPTLSELEKFEEQSLADMEVCILQMGCGIWSGCVYWKDKLKGKLRFLILNSFYSCSTSLLVGLTRMNI